MKQSELGDSSPMEFMRDNLGISKSSLGGADQGSRLRQSMKPGTSNLKYAPLSQQNSSVGFQQINPKIPLDVIKHTDSSVLKSPMQNLERFSSLGQAFAFKANSNELNDHALSAYV